MKKYDVIVVGGGFAGVAASIAAAREGAESAEIFSVKVTFIDDETDGITFDNNDAKDNSVTFDLVVSAIQQTKRPA